MTDTTSTTLDPFTQNYTQKALQGVKQNSNTPIYGSKPGESLYTPTNNMQNTAISNVNAMAGQNLDERYGLNAANSLWDQYANAAPSHVGTTGVMDDNGPFGSFQSYMNPYIQQVLAPQMREIYNASAINQNNIGAQAAGAGAFGDARHGIADAENFRLTQQAAGDATGRAYSDAFGNAQNARMQDLGRLLTSDMANQRVDENATERLGTAATAKEGLGQHSFDYQTKVNDMLMNGGNFLQQNAETQRTAKQNYQQALNNKKYDAFIKQLQAVSGAPRGSTSTTEKSIDWTSLLGALF
jgi:hypothetical protein